jgi:hypothetical protein
MIARYITHYDLDLYERCGWRCQFLRIRGDDLHCFLATFQCCEGT